MTYKESLTEAMTWLGKQSNTIFVGQGVRYPGHSLFDTLQGVPESKRIEMPVAEDMQMGISIGLSLNGYLPITIYPRMDFLLCAMNQLVNHLHHMAEYTDNEWQPHVIVRTCIGARSPLDPGIQHTGDYTETLRTLFPVVKLTESNAILPAYQKAYETGGILIEDANLYNQ